MLFLQEFRKFIARPITILGHLFLILGRVMYSPPPPRPSVQESRTQPWREMQGDATLRLDYDLDNTSLVFDVGGFDGRWSAEIHARYGSKIHIFEPVNTLAEEISRKFSRNPKLIVHHFGLGKEDVEQRISLALNESSTFKVAEQSEIVSIRDIAKFIKESGIDKIDLLKVNIEGGEYDLLERLLDASMISMVVNIQVQFHDFVPNADQRMLQIQQRLSLTHEPTYQFPFVWENWRLK
jgi:FkbM family methyltransferase